ncbi:hypothetical protein TELCIR_07240 [Teladorsagia circumcincta]|uniref:Phorbol-ester/DAG-type domain-containing protein n=1 Tax=Teladorsagia circumcincta TaxID=45464 RepID=A0A2G9UKY5_TELCI|nr:hypothetical protein TELCIR_07240 [Teladorsagia circumcincta]
MSTYCDICSKKLSDLVRPPPAYECKNCRLKIHKDHVNTPQLTVCKYTGVVREWLLMALTKEECNQWVNAMAFTPNGYQLAVAAFQKVKIYDMTALKPSNHISPLVCFEQIMKNVTAIGFEVGVIHIGFYN